MNELCKCYYQTYDDGIPNRDRQGKVEIYCIEHVSTFSQVCTIFLNKI